MSILRGLTGAVVESYFLAALDLCHPAFMHGDFYRTEAQLPDGLCQLTEYFFADRSSVGLRHGLPFLLFR